MVGAELDDFHDDWGRYPTTAEGLAVLALPSKSGESYFLKRGYSVDTWENECVYRSPGNVPGRPYDLYSARPNAADEGGHGDDVDY